MANVRVTVSIDETQLSTIRRLVEADQADSVSGFVRKSIDTVLALDGAASWYRVVDETLARTGGPVTDGERAWADGVLDGSSDHPWLERVRRDARRRGGGGMRM